MISVIIPTYNEALNIEETIKSVNGGSNAFPIEIIVIDGGSLDATVEIAKQNGATVYTSQKKGRAAQMNLGAAHAKGDILYFLHADSIPPQNFTAYIVNAVENDVVGGCFRLKFDYQHWFLKTQSWFTRFNVNAVRSGDQSLFVLKDVFIKCRGFNEGLQIMEDQEIIHRIRKLGKFKVLNASVTTSARKYINNGVYRMQGIFYRIWLMYYLGYSQESLLKVHRTLIRGTNNN